MAKIQHKLLYLFLSFVTLYFIVFVSVFVLISSVGICLFGAMDQAASSAISISDWQLIRRRSRLVSFVFLFTIILSIIIILNIIIITIITITKVVAVLIIGDWQLIRRQSRLVSTVPPFILLAFVCIQFNPCYRSITPF